MEVDAGFSARGNSTIADGGVRLPHTGAQGQYQHQLQKVSRPESRVAKINLTALDRASPLLRSLSHQTRVEHLVLTDFAGSTVGAQPSKDSETQGGFKGLSVLTRDHLGVGHKLGLPPALSPSVLQPSTGTISAQTNGQVTQVRFTQSSGQGTGEQAPAGTDVTSTDTDRVQGADLTGQLCTVLGSLQKGSLRALTLTLLAPLPTPFTSAIALLAEGGQLACLDALPTLLSQADQWQNLHSVTIQIPGFDSALGAAVSVLLAHPQSNIKALALNLIPAPGTAAAVFPIVPESIDPSSSASDRGAISAPSGESMTATADESDPPYASIVALLEGLRSCKCLNSIQLSGFPTASSARSSLPMGDKLIRSAKEALQTNSIWRQLPATAHSRDISMGTGVETVPRAQEGPGSLQITFNGDSSTISM